MSRIVIVILIYHRHKPIDLYQGYWKNRPSHQLFKVFIYIYFTATCFGPRWPSNTQLFPPEDGQRGLKHVGGDVNINKHFKQLLRGTVLPVTLIKYVQQDAEPQNKNLKILFTETFH
jgi:hypothetical protein